MFEWLNDFKLIKTKIEYYEFQLSETQAELKRWLEGDLVNVHLTKGSRAEKIEGCIDWYKNELKHLYSRRDKLTKLIKGFEDLDSQILVMRYVEGKSLYEISEELDYSYDHIRAKHSRLIQAIKLADKISMDDLENV